MRKMMSGDINDPVTSGILVELDGVAPVMVQSAPELNWAAYVLVRERFRRTLLCTRHTPDCLDVHD